MKCLYIFTIAITGLHAVRASQDWTYWGLHGPERWPGICTKGHKQSPVNIVTEDAIKTDLGALKFIRYDFAFPGKIISNGHSVQILLDGVPAHLEGGNLPSTYILEQMHFHWPAEHTIDGNRGALELHFVHYRNEYNNTDAASQYENGIAVVATLFQLHNEDNLDIEPILEGTKLVSKWVGENTALLSAKVIPYLFLPKDHTTYYNYDGSLTTPGCQESVIWIVLPEKLKISQHQLNIFKNVGTGNGSLEFNYRPIQVLGDRKVYHHLNGYSTATHATFNLFFMLFNSISIKLLQIKLFYK